MELTTRETKIVFTTDLRPKISDIIDVYRSSGISRPVDDFCRIAAMYAHANLIVTAWDGGTLVGVARSLTDFCYCCYLSDLAVRKEYQASGIGRELIACIREKIGDLTALILLSAPDAMDYYPKIGFEKADNAFIIRRSG
jgi:N-acetylglutamate synthase-like GNAT family acetyltransferase